MAKISLRAYNREIQDLISHSHTDEAIAHCKYILKLFPKHIDTYRLLGQAYLENQRYSEATDILRRTLSVIPEDFISQVGMSVIREDEGNLDAAIWHMERAFEVQPSNATIQDELRRLYGQRDGIEPPKMRLTRGALVRMYARGELYPQAIAEIRSALNEDTPRPDLEVLLARMYYLLGQNSDSIKISKRIIEKLPFCYEPNRILAEFLPETRDAELTINHKEKVNALDPYSIFIAENAPTSEQIPDNAIMLERLNYSPDQNVDHQPEWATTVGADIGDESGLDGIDWLPEGVPEIDFHLLDSNEDKKPFYHQNVTEDEESDLGQSIVNEVNEDNGAPPTLQSLIDFDSLEEDVAGADMNEIEPADEAIPNWMKEAGWDKGEGDAAEDQMSESIFDEPDKPVEEAQLPDWLQAAKPDTESLSIQDMAPNEETPVSENNLVSDEAPDILAPELNISDDDEEPEWLGSAKLPEISSFYPEANSDNDGIDNLLPDKENDDSLIEPEELENSTPEPLEADIGADQSMINLDETPLAAPLFEENNQDDLPDWFEPSTSKEDTYTGADLTAFLQTQQPMIARDADDEIKMDDPVSEDNFEEEIKPADLDDDASFAWLESLAAKRGADPETLFTTTDEHLGNLPEGEQEKIEDLESFLSETAAVQEVEEEPIQEPMIPPSNEEIEEDEGGIDPTEMDEDASFTWLESLAAKRGADPESLLTLPGEHLGTQPDPTPPEQFSSEIDQDQSSQEVLPEDSQPSLTTEGQTKILSEDDVNTDENIEETLEESQEQPQTMPAWVIETEVPPGDSPHETEPTLPAWIQETGFLEEPESIQILDDSSIPTDSDDHPSSTDEIKLPELMSDEYIKAQNLLSDGNISDALAEYNSLIKSQINLDVIIKDLQQALEIHPVDPEIWGTLGYAYQYSDRIRDALDAYTKAEEFLR
jgi:tetratricopeptide (TPR) repeat protein